MNQKYDFKILDHCVLRQPMMFRSRGRMPHFRMLTFKHTIQIEIELENSFENMKSFWRWSMFEITVVHCIFHCCSCHARSKGLN